MKSIAVDFRTISGPPRWAWIGLGSLIVIAAALVVVATFGTHRLTVRQAELDALRAQVASAGLPSKPAPRKMPYDAGAREFLALATSQWPAMLTALETVEIPGVTPTSIDISPAERTLRVDVDFADYPTLLKYVDALNAGEPAPRWALVQAQVSIRSAASAAGTIGVAAISASW